MAVADPPKEPWGKLRDRSSPDPSQSPRLSLVAHCIDVAAVMKALLALPTWQQRLDKLAGRALTELDMQRLCALTFLHDIGKAGAGFYSKGVTPEVLRAWRATHLAGRSQSGHVSVVAPLFESDDSFDGMVEGLGVEPIIDWGPDATDLWLAAISRHGEPVTLQTLRRNVPSTWPTWKSSIDGYQPLHGSGQLGRAVRSLFPDGFATDIVMRSSDLAAYPTRVVASNGTGSTAASWSP